MTTQAASTSLTAASAARRVLQACVRNALDVLFPPLCLHCGDPRVDTCPWFCAACLDVLSRTASERDRCPRCSVNRELRECTCDLAWDFPFERIFSLFDYGDHLRTIAHAVKYRGMGRLAAYMGQTFADRVDSSFWLDADTVVPVPLHHLRRLRRGYNQAACFAQGVMEARGGTDGPEYLPDALTRTRNTRTQTKLDSDQRAANLAGAFTVPVLHAPRIIGRCVILVDDIVTTGATTAECTHALLNAGAREVRVLSLARD